MVVQAEQIEAKQNIEAIVRVPAVNALLVGPYELSASLGRIGKVVHPEVRQAIARVRDACKEAGLTMGILELSAAAVVR